MKRFWFIMCSALTLTLFAGCKGDEPAPVPTPADAPQLTLDTTSVDVTADGGTFTVGFELLNAIEGAEVKVSAEQTWVHNIQVLDGGVISFDVDASYEAGERKCRLEVTYPEVYPNPTILVKQAEGKKHSIELNLVSAAGTTITLDVVPQDKNMPYVFILGNGDYIQSNGLMTDDEALWASDMDIFQSFADAFGGDVATAAMAFMYSGDLLSHQFTGVTPNTEYVAYAYGFDTTTLKPTTEISRLLIKTSEVKDYILHFDLSAQVDGYNVVLDVTPQGYDGYFFYGVFEARQVPEGTSDELMREYCEAAWEQEKAYYSSFFDDVESGLHFIFNELAYRGTAHLEVDLDANTKYVLWAFGMDDEALLNTTPEYIYFTTGSAAASDNKLTVSVDNIHPRKADVTVTTTNNDPYAAVLLTSSRLEGLTDDQVVEYCISNFNIKAANGTMTDTASGLAPETEYEVVVFGYAAGTATTAPQRVKFTTPEAVMADLEFELEVGRYYDGGELAAIDPSWNNYAGYAIVPVSAIVDPAAVNFYYSVMYTEEFGVYGYEYLIQGLIYQGSTELTDIYAVEYGDTLTFFGVAEDVNGDYTEMWSSKPIFFKEDGCSPAEEFFGASTASLAAAPQREVMRSVNGLLNL